MQLNLLSTVEVARITRSHFSFFKMLGGTPWVVDIICAMSLISSLLILVAALKTMSKALA